jgi:hypothetical protein
MMAADSSLPNIGGSEGSSPAQPGSKIRVGDFESLAILGRGAFGEVRKVLHLTDAFVAVTAAFIFLESYAITHVLEIK